VTVIRINAITVPEDSGDELAARFAARAGAVDDQDGFEGFELLKPTDGRSTWLVVTRWRDEAAFDAWVSSPAFGHGHRSERPASEGGRGARPSGSTASCGPTRSPAARARGYADGTRQQRSQA
jgi:heme-degrading monooxygenase HmoA